MRTSETTDKVAPALVAIQGAVGRTVGKSSEGHGYRYAELADVLRLVHDALTEHGCALVSSQPDAHHVVTRLLHSSGQWIEVAAALSVEAVEVAGEGNKRAPHGPQAAGSAYTYGRRYGVMALLGLAGEDDDGAAASTRPSARPQRGQAPPPQTKGAFSGLPPCPQCGGALEHAHVAKLDKWVIGCVAKCGWKPEWATLKNGSPNPRYQQLLSGGRDPGAPAAWDEGA